MRKRKQITAAVIAHSGPAHALTVDVADIRPADQVSDDLTVYVKDNVHAGPDDVQDAGLKARVETIIFAGE